MDIKNFYKLATMLFAMISSLACAMNYTKWFPDYFNFWFWIMTFITFFFVLYENFFPNKEEGHDEK